MVLDGAQAIDDAVGGVDDQQQVGQGIEHGALAAFAFFELLHQPSAAHQVLHAMAEQVPVDGLREKVRRACLVGMVDRGHVVASRDHHDRQVGAARQRADQLARVVAVHRRHFHVHEHGIAGAGLDGRHGRGAIRRLGNHKAGTLERAAHQQARAGVVVDDEYVDGFLGWFTQATFADGSSASSSDSATVRCARSLVSEVPSSARSPPRAECSIWRAIAATLVAPRFALELFKRVRSARHSVGIADLQGIVDVGEQL